MKLKAAVIGVGNIAAFIDSPKSDTVASHTKAYMQCERTLLGDAYEPDPKQHQAFVKRWGEGVVFHPSIDALLSQNPDILSITSPTPFHYEALKQALDSNARYILCEKPLVASLEEIEALKDALANSSKKILVNIIREYNPTYREIAKKRAAFGRPVGFFGVCTKGLLHNGIHLLALVEQFIAPIDSIETCRAHCKGSDITGSFTPHTSICSGEISVLDTIDYSEFELTIWFENAKLHFKNGGDELLIFTKEAAEFEGYNKLQLTKHYNGLLRHYALDSLRFLLDSDLQASKAILKKHLDLHQKIFQTIKKECG